MKSFEELEEELGYRFQDSQLLKQALTHSSHAHEQNSGADDEQLSKLKGYFVSAANLVKYAEQLRLGQYLHLGKGEEKTGGRTKQALLVDALEAIIAAIYLDGGLEAARRLVSRFMEAQVVGVRLVG